MKYLLLVLLAVVVIAKDSYDQSEPITIMVNKIAPFANPTESYRYSFKLYIGFIMTQIL